VHSNVLDELRYTVAHGHDLRHPAHRAARVNHIS
jgi:hypothetical protein